MPDLEVPGINANICQHPSIKAWRIVQSDNWVGVGVGVRGGVGVGIGVGMEKGVGVRGGVGGEIWRR